MDEQQLSEIKSRKNRVNHNWKEKRNKTLTSSQHKC